MKNTIYRTKGFFLLFLLYFYLSPLAFALTPTLPEKNISVAGHSIFYNDVGQGTPIVLVHGLFANKEQWGELIPLLDGQHRVIALDLPGFGKSLGFPFKDYDLNNQILLIHKFLTKLSIQNFHIAGNSMGGAISALYTQKYPQEIISLALIGSPLGVKTPQLSETNRLFAKGENPFLPTTQAGVEQLFHLLFVHPPTLTEDKINAMIQDNKKNYFQKNKISQEVMDPFRNLFAQITLNKPSLIIWGLEDKIFDVSGAALLHKKLLKSDVVILKGTGHLPHVDCAKTTAEVYLSFLHSIAGKKVFKTFTKEVMCTE